MPTQRPVDASAPSAQDQSGSSLDEKNSELSLAERIAALRIAIPKLREKEKWSLDDVALYASISRKALTRLLDPDDTGRSREKTVANLEKLTRDLENPGFVGQDMYLSIAHGLGVTEDDRARFIAAYANKHYRIIRAHVPSLNPLISALEIVSEPNDVIRYTHSIYAYDSFSLYGHRVYSKDPPEKKEKPKLTYNGFVFPCWGRAFLISTSHETKHIKEIILSLPETGRFESTLRGLVLSLSADEREPFAARVVLEEYNETLVNHLKADKSKAPLADMFVSGLKESWDNIPKDVRTVCGPEAGYGLLTLHASPLVRHTPLAHNSLRRHRVSRRF